MNYRIWTIQYAGSPKTVWRHVRPTPTQMEKAAQLGIQVSPDDTFSEVASRILEEVGDAIGCPPRGISDSQYELAEELGIDLSDCKSLWVAFVRIKEAIQLANLDAVRQMRLEPGDRVTLTDTIGGRHMKEDLGERWDSVAQQFSKEFEVSSIRDDGHVFFKGGSRQAPARYLDKVVTSD